MTIICLTRMPLKVVQRLCIHMQAQKYRRPCRDKAEKKAEEAVSEAASSRQQVSAAAERAAGLRSKMESLRAEADTARQAGPTCQTESSS